MIRSFDGESKKWFNYAFQFMKLLTITEPVPRGGHIAALPIE